ncbi:phosphotransferase, partial [Kineococcus sp. T13]|uniref:phosphotransferase enzyme family protein n=1 Tax=Kineococcus vitellinus TaxID=2696565 RepID=UPI0014136263
PAAFATLTALRRGDEAPGWLTASVTRAWGLDPAATALHLITVSENATFRVDVAGAAHAVLRLHRPGYVDPAEIAAELAWVRAIAAETEVRVPAVLALADGSLVHETTGPDGGRWCAVAFSHVDGQVLEDRLGSPAALVGTYREIGATAARLHEHARGWVQPRGFRRFGWALADALGATSRWGDWRAAPLGPGERAVCERAEAAARAVLERLGADAGTTGLVHADLRPSNVVVDGAGRLTVIDFDDCGTSWLLWDFAAALSFLEHEEHAPALAAAWLEGYGRVRRLREADLELATALSMVRRLQLLGWTTTHREDALPPAVWAAQLPGTVEVARRYLGRPQWLLAP